MLIRLNKRKGAQCYWVAVVDCRGEKARRRFFTTWHEIVHCITAADQYELPFHRTRIRRDLIDPVERLTDAIAAQLAFFDPLFAPIVEQETRIRGLLTFECVENVRQRFCSDASFEATLNACVSRTPSPIILVKASLALKDAEREAMGLTQRQLFPLKPAILRLRVTSAIVNAAARRASFRIHRNMRIPSSSIISSVFYDAQMFRGSGTENLNAWTTSGRGALSPLEVTVEARKSGDQVFALIAPTSIATTTCSSV